MVNREEVGNFYKFYLLMGKKKKKVENVPVFIPIFCISGIGGNLVAIQASRISTYLHLHSIPGELPEEAKGCYYPCRTYYGTGMY